jgi:hypothetical protein
MKRLILFTISIIAYLCANPQQNAATNPSIMAPAGQQTKACGMAGRAACKTKCGVSLQAYCGCWEGLTEVIKDPHCVCTPYHSACPQGNYSMDTK